jgi:hypothetical protein
MPMRRVLASNIGLTVVFGLAWAVVVAGGFAIWKRAAPDPEPAPAQESAPSSATAERWALFVERDNPDPVRSAAAGRVEFAGKADGMGGLVVVDHGEGLRGVYYHLGEVSVKEGDAVAQGSPLGNAGRSAGAGAFAAGFEALRDEEPAAPSELLGTRSPEEALF